MKKRLCFSENEIKEIVAEHLRNDGYIVTKDQVEILIERTTQGYGISERVVSEFRGVSVVIE